MQGPSPLAARGSMGRLLKAVVLGFFVVALCVDGQITASHTTPRRAAARRRQQAAQAAAHTNVGDSPVRPLERFPHSKPGQLDCLTDRAIPNWDSQEVTARRCTVSRDECKPLFVLWTSCSTIPMSACYSHVCMPRLYAIFQQRLSCRHFERSRACLMLI